MSYSPEFRKKSQIPPTILTVEARHQVRHTSSQKTPKSGKRKH